MNPNYTILTDLLKELESFQLEKQPEGADASGTDAFVQWLASKRLGIQAADLDEKLQWNGKGHGGRAHYTASNLLTALGRYKMSYVKLALEGSPFETYDEFAFVLSLVFAGPYTQSQLIERHVQLKATGTEVIKRLVRKKLIEQEASAADKRSKVLRATAAGKAAFYETLPKINAITDMVMAPLSGHERLQLLQLLQKLDEPHRKVFSSDRKHNLADLMERFGVGDKA